MSRGWAARAATVSVAVVLAAVGLGMPGPLVAEAATTSATQETQAPPSMPAARGANRLPTLDSTLQDDLAAGAPVNPASAARTGDLRPPEGTPVTVVVEAADPAAARAAVEAVGGEVTVELEDRVQADVLATQLAELATADGVSFVREPIPVQSTAMSEGVASTGASRLADRRVVRLHREVAVLDVGFANYLSQVGPTGELGPDVVTDFSRCADGEADSHGTATAEIVHDMAPESPLHLVCVETEEGLISAMQSMAARGVCRSSTARSRSSGSVGATAAAPRPRPSPAPLRALRRQGILFVGSARQLRREPLPRRRGRRQTRPTPPTSSTSHPVTRSTRTRSGSTWSPATRGW